MTRPGDLRRRRVARLAGVALVLLAVAALFLLFPPGPEQPAPAAKKDGDANDLPSVACGAERPERGPPKQYGKAPAMSLDRDADYGAVIETSCGRLAIDLLEDRAPITVNNFVFLANEGFYDGLRWHRVEPKFVIQTGDPNGQAGDPPDGPGYTIPDETSGLGGRDYVYGVVAMANNGPGTGGSQFFVVVHRGPRDEIEPAGIQADFTIFGRVEKSSYDTLERITEQETKGEVAPEADAIEDAEPLVPIYVERVKIVRR